jgi:N-acetylmuramoyl-L-alanine amidase
LVKLRIVLVTAALAATACSSASSHGTEAKAVGSTATSAPASVLSPVPDPSTSSAGAASSTTSSSLSVTTFGAQPTSTTAKPPAAPATTAAPVADQRVAASGAYVVGDKGAAVASQPGGPVTGRLRAGVALAVDALQGAWAHVLTPCENHVWVPLADGRIQKTADIVIDAGHGGSEPGAVGQGGLTEKELNLAVARMVVDDLAAQGVSAALARTGDYQQTLASRVAVAAAMHPKAFVSIHHNAEPDGPRPQGPGTETYYQTGKEVSAAQAAQSKRLAGLIYEEVVKTLSQYSASWVADTDAGAKYRIGDSGNDYYGVLRISGADGIVGSLAELAFLSNPSEEYLLKRDDVRHAEAAAVARGIVRYLRTNDPGSGFTVPYPRTEPAGGGGGTAGCIDPS